MKKQTIVVSMLALGIFAGAAIAAPPYTDPGQGVLGSLHDMNKIDAGNPDPEGRVCAFCHTPHHAVQDPSGAPQPLWSKSFTAADPAAGNMVAYQSPYYTLDIPDPLIGPSRLCMSCHDGVIAADQHYNIPGVNVLTDDNFGGRAIGKKNAAGLYDFSNDHPIGMNYGDAATAAGNLANGAPNIWPSSLKFLDVNLQRTGKTIDATLTNGIMTCATCHDVHNKENVVNPIGGRNYFVYAPQDNSALCISCHNKANNQ